MGGQALKNTFTRRYNKDEFFLLYYEVFTKLKELCYDKEHPENHIKLVESYSTKETFGDMDILLNKDYFDVVTLKKRKMDVVLNSLHDLFRYSESYNNSPVFSFDYKELQIDLVFVKNEHFKTALIYYNMSDLGNLMGRIAVKLGVRYGHFGLKYKLISETSDKILGEFILSKNPKEYFEFLGFDYERYLKGFETLEDVFEFVISSKYFDKEIFAYENLDHQNRTRNRKRESYRKFLEYIEPKTFGENILPSKEERLKLILESFPQVHLEEKIEELKKKEKLKKVIKSKFNGNIIMKLIPELSGKELGKFIQHFKNLFYSDETFNETVLKSSQQTINTMIQNEYNFYKRK